MVMRTVQLEVVNELQDCKIASCCCTASGASKIGFRGHSLEYRMLLVYQFASLSGTIGSVIGFPLLT